MLKIWRICCIISCCTSPISVLHEISISVVCAPGVLLSFHSHFNWELTANVTAGPWKGRKMKSGSNKEVAILQGHRRKRDLFEGLAGNFPLKKFEEKGTDLLVDISLFRVIPRLI